MNKIIIKTLGQYAQKKGEVITHPTLDVFTTE